MRNFCFVAIAYDPADSVKPVFFGYYYLQSESSAEALSQVRCHAVGRNADEIWEKQEMPDALFLTPSTRTRFQESIEDYLGWRDAMVSVTQRGFPTGWVQVHGDSDAILKKSKLQPAD